MAWSESARHGMPRRGVLNRSVDGVQLRFRPDMPENPIKHHAVELNVRNSEDRSRAANLLVTGEAPLFSLFGNIIGAFSNPQAEAVGDLNELKGRPRTQTGSVTTSPDFYKSLVDWDAHNTDAIDPQKTLALIEHLSRLGPIGFLLPAADHVPPHLSRPATFAGKDVKTVQLIVPGQQCPFGEVVGNAVRRMPDSPFIFATSGNMSKAVTGTEQAAHHRFGPMLEEFAEEGRTGLTVLSDDEQDMWRRHPFHEPRSTTIVRLHDVHQGENGESRDHKGRPVIEVTRHGSTHEGYLRQVLNEHGFGVAFPKDRIPERHYSIGEKVISTGRLLRANVRFGGATV